MTTVGAIPSGARRLATGLLAMCLGLTLFAPTAQATSTAALPGRPGPATAAPLTNLARGGDTAHRRWRPRHGVADLEVGLDRAPSGGVGWAGPARVSSYDRVGRLVSKQPIAGSNPMVSVAPGGFTVLTR